MAAATRAFDKRLSRIVRTRRKIREGSRTHVDATGLVTVRPRRQTRLPMGWLLALAGGFFVFKGLLLASLGAPNYGERIAALGQGTIVEQAGAWIMQIEPVTTWIAAQLVPILY